MPAAKQPCTRCKEKHVKCDEGSPKCRRCELKQLPCSRPEKRSVFRQGSAANFSKDQRWVRSNPTKFQLESRTESGATSTLTWDAEPGATRSQQAGEHSHGTPSQRHSPRWIAEYATSPQSDSFPPGPLQSPTHRASNPDGDSRLPSLAYLAVPPPQRGRDAYVTRELRGFIPQSIVSLPDEPLPQITRPVKSFLPLEDIQEACLFRYYVEELAQWFDLCDEERHFELVVPIRARYQPHLLHAIFALAARHLSRVPQFKSPQGILYHGQVLRNLDESTAVEYMLKCIPALRHFHDSRDDDYRDSIIATAVILRQLEEIDDEHESQKNPESAYHPPPVNFLAVIDSVLRSSTSQNLFNHRSLIQASYWMALRQEIFHSFTKRQPPQMFLDPEYWQGASNANKAVIHTIQVAKWLWGDKSESEWERLDRQQDHLEQNVLVDFLPIFRRPPDKSKGEIFPTVWYSSNVEVLSILLSTTSKMVLVAENPVALRNQAAWRSSWRNVENQVRQLTLELCGIALYNSASPATLVNAALGIQLYGDYFTDQYERLALKGVVERYRDAHAWPVQELLDMFK